MGEKYIGIVKDPMKLCQQLWDENARLRARVAELEATLQKLYAIEEEHFELCMPLGEYIKWMVEEHFVNETTQADN